MRVRRLCVPVWLALLGATAARAAPVPRLICQSDGRCALSALPPVLRDAEVLDFLRSGLTTTLVVSVNVRGEAGQKLSANVRIDVRFEPWEEAFDLEVMRPGAPTERLRMGSEALLHAWWRGLALALALPAGARGTASVSVELIPFSEKEQADTRRWYAEALRSSVPGRAGSAGGSGGDPSGFGGVLDSLTITSIQRHGVLRFSWSSPVERVR